MSNTGDPLVLSAQKWLNNTYGSDSRYNIIPENGKTGWTTIYALTRALQIELGIQNTADNFGPTTIAKFNEKYPTGVHQQDYSDESEDNIYAIIQSGLFCKGYGTGVNGVTRHFYDGTGNAIKSLKEDAGCLDATSTVTLNIMKALLSMDYFYSYDTSENVINIQNIQRYLNRNYEDYIGLIPCNGIYERKTNTALIYAIQVEEGMPTSVANGNFGPATKRCCPTIPYSNVETDYNGNLYTDESILKFTKLLKMGLYVNGFGDGNYDDGIVTSLVSNFQTKYALPITGICDLTTWLSIFISCGDIDRNALACDCATILTAEKAKTLYDNGYRYVGRYLSGIIAGGISKALSVEEMQIAFNQGLRIFPIQQGSANTVSYFTEEQAILDAANAYEHAIALGIPENTVIYFAVDCDPLGAQITSNIIPYFAKLLQEMVNTYNNKYKIGIYGTRNVCAQVSESGYALFSFVSDMSTGFSGNLGFCIPENWTFDQFTTITVGTGDGQIEIDKDGFSGRDKGIGSLGLSDIQRVYYHLMEIYRYAKSYNDSDIATANLLTLQYLRHLHPDSEYGIDNQTYGKWGLTAGTIDGTFCSAVDALLGINNADLEFRDPINNEVVYDTLHLAATLNALLFETVDEQLSAYDDLVDYYAGWAGDAITYSKSIKEKNWNQEQANEYICTNVDSKFKLNDYYADIDAVNIAKMLKNSTSLTIPEAFLQYFEKNDTVTNKIYAKTRTTRFIEEMGTYNTFCQTSNTLLTSTVFPYVDLRNMLLDENVDYSEELEMALVAFLNFVADELNSEKNV